MLNMNEYEMEQVARKQLELCIPNEGKRGKDQTENAQTENFVAIYDVGKVENMIERILLLMAVFLFFLFFSFFLFPSLEFMCVVFACWP